MRWVRFKDRFPPPGSTTELICAHAGHDPQLYHWFIDLDGRTTAADFYWLEAPSIEHLSDYARRALLRRVIGPPQIIRRIADAETRVPVA